MVLDLIRGLPRAARRRGAAVHRPRASPTTIRKVLASAVANAAAQRRAGPRRAVRQGLLRRRGPDAEALPPACPWPRQPHPQAHLPHHDRRRPSRRRPPRGRAGPRGQAHRRRPSPPCRRRHQRQPPARVERSRQRAAPAERRRRHEPTTADEPSRRRAGRRCTRPLEDDAARRASRSRATPTRCCTTCPAAVLRPDGRRGLVRHGRGRRGRRLPAPRASATTTTRSATPSRRRSTTSRRQPTRAAREAPATSRSRRGESAADAEEDN